MRKVDYDKWHELLERYFDAQTTDEEEISLRRFLSSPEAVGNEFEEARAVMGFLCVGKEKRFERQRSLWRKSAWMSVAAGVALLICVGIRGMFSDEDLCYAYVSGVKITDTEKVLSEMRQSIGQFGEAESSLDAEAQLKDMFLTMEEFN
jgi:hypothetical protein